MLKQNSIFLLFSMLFVWNCSQAMVYDNRYLPLLQLPFITAQDRPSHYQANVFIVTASSAFGIEQDTTIGFTEFDGIYKQREIGCALTAIGKENPLSLLPFAVGKELQWRPQSKLQGQGFNLSIEQAVTNWLSLGFNCFILRTNTRQTFYLQTQETSHLTPENILVLDRLRESMNGELGITDEHVSQAGFGDIEMYVRFWHAYDYLYKMRRIEAGLRLGALIPTGVLREVNRPASIPYGGNGHAGLYISGDAEFELKEDWKVGLLLRLSKRFAKTKNLRLPVCNEPCLYGAVIAPVLVSPGATVTFSPYVSFENLREGLGMRVLYSLRYHGQDSWRLQTKKLPVPVKCGEACEKATDWGSDYITLNVFYDFGKMKAYRRFDPIVSLAWDIPSALLVTHGAAKTNRISLGVEFNY